MSTTILEQSTLQFPQDVASPEDTTVHRNDPIEDNRSDNSDTATSALEAPCSRSYTVPEGDDDRQDDDFDHYDERDRLGRTAPVVEVVSELSPSPPLPLDGKESRSAAPNPTAHPVRHERAVTLYRSSLLAMSHRRQHHRRAGQQGRSFSSPSGLLFSVETIDFSPDSPSPHDTAVASLANAPSASALSGESTFSSPLSSKRSTVLPPALSLSPSTASTTSSNSSTSHSGCALVMTRASSSSVTCHIHSRGNLMHRASQAQQLPTQQNSSTSLPLSRARRLRNVSLGRAMTLVTNRGTGGGGGGGPTPSFNLRWQPRLSIGPTSKRPSVNQGRSSHKLASPNYKTRTGIVEATVTTTTAAAVHEHQNFQKYQLAITTMKIGLTDAAAREQTKLALQVNDSLVYLGGPCVYACQQCRTHLTCHDDIISKSFHGRHGRAYLLDHAVNVTIGPSEDRLLMTGLHSVCDLFCQRCKTLVGWTYQKAYETSQKYKEGKFIIEKIHLYQEPDYNATYGDSNNRGADEGSVREHANCSTMQTNYYRYKNSFDACLSDWELSLSSSQRGSDRWKYNHNSGNPRSRRRPEWVTSTTTMNATPDLVYDHHHLTGTVERPYSSSTSHEFLFVGGKN